MATVTLIEYEDASPEVWAVYDDIRAVRNSDFINNFWKGLANNPEELRATWQRLKAVMGPGHIDALTKEMIYIAVSAAVRVALPRANPSLYLPMPLAVTFPFNIALGIPLYYGIISALWS